LPQLAAFRERRRPRIDRLVGPSLLRKSKAHSGAIRRNEGQFQPRSPESEEGFSERSCADNAAPAQL
jgi:hypothetical protein